MQVQKAELLSDYYQTYETKTTQIYPDADWDFVVHSNSGEVEPFNIRLKYVWVGYDTNSLGLHYYDITGEVEDGCGVLVFDDVKPISGPDWKDMDLIRLFPIPCEALDETLTEQLEAE
jgi:hypothetical protein